MFFKSNQHLFKTNGYHMYETRKRNKFEKIKLTSKFEKSPYYSYCIWKVTELYQMFPNKIV